MIGRIIPGASDTLVERIIDKIAAPSDENGCWYWMGACVTCRDGVMRPKIQVGGRGSSVMLVARLLIAITLGEPIWKFDGHAASHSCHHWWCVNQAHLRFASQSENELDKRHRGTDRIPMNPAALAAWKAARLSNRKNLALD